MVACAHPVTCLVTYLMLISCGIVSCELLKNGGFESGMNSWHCDGFHCQVLGSSSNSHSGSHALRTNGRTHTYQGPSQYISVEAGKYYLAKSWVRILNDKAGTLGQFFKISMSFHFPDNTNRYINVVIRPLMTTSDGWIYLQGEFQAPQKAVTSAKFYYQGPEPGVDFAVDQASVTLVTSGNLWRNETDDAINRIRKSDINVQVTTASNIDRSAVQIQILQKKKSFPFGTQVTSSKYADPMQQRYRDFIHQHFNWAVPGNALKWRQLDWHQGPGDTLYSQALDTLTGLKNAGLKIRGHNMVWSVSNFIPVSVKAQSGDQLRATVKEHIRWTLNATKGYLEHWDVNNENLHGQWFQERLHDRDYDLELFRMMYQNDPYPKLFLNDYRVVAQGAATSAYLAQIHKMQNASVHLYGIGAQCHFLVEEEPSPVLIKQHLDTLASTGLPIWATELNVNVADENKRADYLEKALRALYGHPAIEGIMFWGMWATSSSSDHKCFVTGDDMQLTAAGRRVLDLLENQWMTDETHRLRTSHDHFTVRGFHGDYEMRVLYHEHELQNLRQTFTLGKTPQHLKVNVHS